MSDLDRYKAILNDAAMAKIVAINPIVQKAFSSY